TAPEPAPTAAEPAPAAAEPAPTAPGEANAVAPSADEPRAGEAVPPEEPPPPPGGEEPEGGNEPAAPGSSGGEIGGVGATTQAATVVPPGRPKTVGTLIALGFLPLPGMGNVYLADKPGFVANLLVNIAQGWAVVYTVGLHAESARQMVSRSILIPYGIAVLVNQVTGAVGWARHRKGAAPGVVVAPGIEDGRLDGVRLSLGGTF
ncbi:hypothetical protein L6R50_22685, partial [Myxococcota bacterium]|nr:hypothetical protein [Myxococcota bacterium]